MLFLSIKTYDGVVVDDYYKDGKSIIARHDEDDYATSMGLNAILSQSGTSITLQLNGQLQPVPEVLNLHIIFPTTKAFDVTVPLEHRGLGRYHAQLPEGISGKRSLNLHPDTEDKSWRLFISDVVFPLNSDVSLAPKTE